MDKVNNKDKRNYEISFLLKGKEEASLVEKLLIQYEAEILYRGPVMETRLAYPIKKLSLAYFGFFQFSVSPDAVEKISSSLKLSAAVLRMLILTPPIMRSEKFSRGDREARPSNGKVSASVSPAPVSSRGGALTNEALEEKLEEILK